MNTAIVAPTDAQLDQVIHPPPGVAVVYGGSGKVILRTEVKP